MKKLLFCSIIMLFISGIANADTIYVDNCTSAHNSCSSPSDNDYSPVNRTCGSGTYKVYNTIKGAANDASAGDTVYIREGVYVEQWIVPVNSGNPDQYITYQAYPGENVVTKAYQPVENPQNPKGGIFMVSSDNCSYVQFKDLKFQDYSNAFQIGYVGRKAFNKRNIIIDNCTFDNNHFSIFLDAGAKDVTIRNCRFENNQFGIIGQELLENIVVDNNTFLNGRDYAGDDGNWNTGHHICFTFRLDNETTSGLYIKDITIKNNEVSGSLCQGILVQGQSQNVLIRGNHCSYSGATGIQIEGGPAELDGSNFIAVNKVVIEDNICEFNSQIYAGETGIWIDDTDNAVVQNNIIRNNPSGLLLTGAYNCIVRNNIIYGNEMGFKNGGSLQRAAAFPMMPGKDNIIVHNMFYGNGGSEYDYLFGFAQVIINDERHIAGNEPTYYTVFKNNIAAKSRSNSSTPDLRLLDDNETLSPIVHYYNELDYNNYYTSRSTGLGIKWNGDDMTWSQYLEATDHDNNSLVSNPLFVSPTDNDLRLNHNSPCIDHGGFLTTAANSGNDSTTLVVNDARYFSDGYGVVAGDLIKVGAVAPVTITSVNYDNNTITLASPISWNEGDNASYPFEGTRPDIGSRQEHNCTDDIDNDGDGLVDGADPDCWDTDNDGFRDIEDNCPTTSNDNQSDVDGDGIGDVCDECNSNLSCCDYTATVQEHRNAERAGAAYGWRWAVGSEEPICDNACDNQTVTLYENTAEPGYYYIGQCPDNDSDTYPADVDCNDNNASVNPGATEVCNGIDDDCDGQIDEGVKNTYYRDTDGDGYGNPDNSTQACSAPSGYVANNTDNCPAVSNPSQSDTDGDGIGDACDDCNEYTATVLAHRNAGRADAYWGWRWAVGSEDPICSNACDNLTVTLYENTATLGYFSMDPDICP